MKKFFLCFFIGLSFMLSGQQSIPDSLAFLFFKQLAVFPQEKIYLHTDKPYYIAGERIWFRAHVVNAADHTPLSVSRYVYAELFNPSDSLIVRVKISNGNDSCHGYIDIPRDVSEGDYTLHAYTRFMLNLDEHYRCTKTVRIGNPESRKESADIKMLSEADGSANIRIPAADSDFDVTFYPEGGSLLQGVFCRVAFRALMSDGRPANVEGVVYDQYGNGQGQIYTDYAGMGSFTVNSEEGVSYYAVCTNDRRQTKRFELPAALKTGYALSVNNTSSDNIYVSVLKSGREERQEPLYLIAHTRGIVYFAAQWDEKRDLFSLPKKQHPSGVLHLVLFDSSLNPVSERLLFVNNNDQARVSYRSDRDSYAARSFVNSHVTLTDEHGQPLSGSFSVSVTDGNAVVTDSTAGILTELLLTSDLRGNIENPAAYFRDDRLSAVALDLLMLTQGWRRYDVAELAQGRPSRPAIPLEAGSEITGKVMRLLNNKPEERAMVSIVSSDGDYFDLTETDSDGRFRFTGCDMPDSTAFTVHAVPKSVKGNLELLVDSAGAFPEWTRAIPVPAVEENKKPLEQYVEKAVSYNRDKDGDIIWTVEIPEVAVTARKPVPKSVIRPGFVINEETIKRAPKNRGMESVLEGIAPRITLEKGYIGMAENILYDGYPFRALIIDDQTSPPLRFEAPIMDYNSFIVDTNSTPMNISFLTDFVETFIDEAFKYVYDLLKTINPENVTQIFIAEVHSRTPYHPPVTELVIICKSIHEIFYKDNNYHIKNIQPPGYQRPVEFYAPKYDSPEARANTAFDARTTIHWQPDVRTDSLGIATFGFYTADTESTYSVIIEGVTADGKIIRKEEKLWRND